MTIGRPGNGNRKLRGGMEWRGQKDGNLYEWVLARTYETYEILKHNVKPEPKRRKLL